jgi:hypothetical protein
LFERFAHLKVSTLLLLREVDGKAAGGSHAGFIM